ncbi:MAG TPA: helix-turn-helix domain-containing protein [Gemmatimonadaceae bacterium]
MRYDQYQRTPGCAVEACLEVIGGKWKGAILHYLLGGTRRFGELRRLLPAVTQRMLTNQLRELERDGVITRTVYAEVPPRVEYALTELGRALGPLLALVREWGDAYFTRHPAMLGAEAADDSGAAHAGRAERLVGDREGRNSPAELQR